MNCEDLLCITSSFLHLICLKSHQCLGLAAKNQVLLTEFHLPITSISFKSNPIRHLSNPSKTLQINTRSQSLHKFMWIFDRKSAQHQSLSIFILLTGQPRFRHFSETMDSRNPRSQDLLEASLRYS